MTKLHNILLVLLVCTFTQAVIPQTNFYVKPVSTGDSSGTSWANAATLNAVLNSAASNDVIHLAAGTYTPSILITNGIDLYDMTFEIKNNISLIGGYPKDPNELDVPSNENQTILNGEIEQGYNAYHVVAITAPSINGQKVSVENIIITGGNAASSGDDITINALSFKRIVGAAVTVGNSKVDIKNCTITDNHSQGGTPGLFAFSNADISIENTDFINNIGTGSTGNGASLWIDESTIRVNNSNFIGNKNSGVGAIHLTNYSKAAFYNSTIAFNVSGFNNTVDTRNGSGIYIRNGSQAQVVNCTMYGNISNGSSAGIALHAYDDYFGTSVDIISSTIVKNNALMQNNATAGVCALTGGCTVSIYNSIITDNTAVGLQDYNLTVAAGTVLMHKKSIVGENIYDNSENIISDIKFIPEGMLDYLRDNGGRSETVQLLLEDVSNPAKQYGMSATELSLLGESLIPSIPDEIMTYDQLGNKRTGNIMGALTANISNVQQQKIYDFKIYARGNTLYIENQGVKLIQVFDAIGQRIASLQPHGDVTTICNLCKGHIYIVNVDNESTKIIL